MGLPIISGTSSLDPEQDNGPLPPSSQSPHSFPLWSSVKKYLFNIVEVIKDTASASRRAAIESCILTEKDINRNCKQLNCIEPS